MEFRKAFKTMFSKPEAGPSPAPSAAATQQKMFDLQVEATSLRLERNQGHVPIEGMKPNSWAARVNPNNGTITAIERKCWCGTTYTFPGLEILYAISPGVKQPCPTCKKPADFARDAFLCLVPASAETVDGQTKEMPREEALKGYADFFKRAADYGTGITINDYVKGLDGNYWAAQSKSYELIKLLNFIPSVAAELDDDGPVFLPIGEGDAEVKYEIGHPQELAGAAAASYVQPEAHNFFPPSGSRWQRKHHYRIVRSEMRGASEEAIDKEVAKRLAEEKAETRNV